MNNRLLQASIAMVLRVKKIMGCVALPSVELDPGIIPDHEDILPEKPILLFAVNQDSIVIRSPAKKISRPVISRIGITSRINDNIFAFELEFERELVIVTVPSISVLPVGPGGNNQVLPMVTHNVNAGIREGVAVDIVEGTFLKTLPAGESKIPEDEAGFLGISDFTNFKSRFGEEDGTQIKEAAKIKRGALRKMKKFPAVVVSDLGYLTVRL